MAIRTMGIGFDAKAWERGEKQPMKVEYEGRVLSTGERNGYNDSDFYATVFTEEGEFKSIEYASTRGWSYPNSATPDASDEVIEEARTAMEEVLYSQYVRKAEGYRPPIQRGSRIEIVRGRKVPKGTTGEVFWVGEGTWGTRIGFNGDYGETYWTAITNAEDRTEPEPVDYDHLRKTAKANANYRADGWRKSRGRTF